MSDTASHDVHAPDDCVVVVGAGPVGLTAALSLATRGVPITVLEAGPTLSAESRASTFHPPTLEMLADLGVYEELAARGLVADRFQYRDRQAGLVAELDLAVLAEDTPYPFRIQCEQSKLTAILFDRLAAAPLADVVFGAQVVDVESSDDAVVARTADGRTWRGDWLLAADGAHSAVRRSIGAGFTGTTYPESFLVVSTTEPIEEHIPGIALVNYIFDTEEWAVLLRTPQHWRVLLPVSDGVADEDVSDRLTRLRNLGRPWSIEHTSLYQVHQRVATSFRFGRVLLAGDAAHVNNPLGGLGMNSGVHDAVQLSEALAAVIDGDPDSQLSAAADERRRVALEVVGRHSHANWQRLRNPDLAVREQVYRDLRATAADPAAARASLLESSLINSLRPAVRIGAPSEVTRR